MNANKPDPKEIPGECMLLRDTGSTYICMVRGSAYCQFHCKETGYVERDFCVYNPDNIIKDWKENKND